MFLKTLFQSRHIRQHSDWVLILDFSFPVINRNARWKQKLSSSAGNKDEKTKATTCEIVRRYTSYLSVSSRPLYCNSPCSLPRSTTELTLGGVVVCLSEELTLSNQGMQWYGPAACLWSYSVLTHWYLVLNICNIISFSQSSSTALTWQWNCSFNAQILGGQLLGCLSGLQWSLPWLPVYSDPQGWAPGNSFMQWLWLHPHLKHLLDWSWNESCSKALL